MPMAAAHRSGHGGPLAHPPPPSAGGPPQLHYRTDSPPHHHHAPPPSSQQHVAVLRGGPPPPLQALNGNSTTNAPPPPSSTQVGGPNGIHHLVSPAPAHAHATPHPSSAAAQQQHHHQVVPPPPQQQQMLPPGASSGPPGAMNGSNGFPPSVALAASSSTPVDVRRGPPMPESLARLAKANEETWMAIGDLAERMGDLDASLNAYENAVRHNRSSVDAHTRIAAIARGREELTKAITHWQRVVELQPDNGDVWSAMGHCFLMQDDLQKAYMAYQQALYFLPNPKDPKLWYGIGILYDRYGSLDHAEEAFSSTLNMDPEFEKADEIYFRLGIIYKQQQKYQQSLDCFQRILRSPPNPLASIDIWFQIGHVYEQMKDYNSAKNAYEHVLEDNPNHAKVLQQLGWLYHQPGTSFCSQDLAIQYLTRSLESDGGDAQSWYLLGRAYMAVTKYQKAYEAYQQAVYRDGRNPTFWCSIGVLYFQINQYRDALDAYSRAIRINPYISEVWFDLGSLYESCNNQIADAIDAYGRAADLDQNNPVIKQRLALLREAQRTGGALPAAPGPQDVHPTAYATVGPPTLFSAAGGNGAVSSPRPLHHENGLLGPGMGGPGMRGGGGPELPRMSSVERDVRAGGPQPMEGVEMQRRDRERDRDGHRDRDHGGPIPLDDRSRGGPPPPLHRGGNDRGQPSSQQLGPMDMDKPYPGMGTGAGGISGSMPSVRPSSRDNERDRDRSGIALHHPQPQQILSPIGGPHPNGDLPPHHPSQQRHPQHGRGGLAPPPPPMQQGGIGRRSPALSDRHPSPLPRGGDRRHGGPLPPSSSTNGAPGPGVTPFSHQQLPPPPSTHVANPPSSYYPPYADSTGSRTPSERDGPGAGPAGRPGESWRGAPLPDRDRDDRGRLPPSDGRDRRREREMSPHGPSSHQRRGGPPPPPPSGPQGSPYYDDRERERERELHRGGPPPPLQSSGSRGYDLRHASPPPPPQPIRDEARYRRSPPAPMLEEPPHSGRRYSDRMLSPGPYGGGNSSSHHHRQQPTPQQQQQLQQMEDVRYQQQRERERERERERDPYRDGQPLNGPPSASGRYDPRHDSQPAQPSHRSEPPRQQQQQQQQPPQQRQDPGGWDRPFNPQQPQPPPPPPSQQQQPPYSPPAEHRRHHEGSSPGSLRRVSIASSTQGGLAPSNATGGAHRESESPAPSARPSLSQQQQQQQQPPQSSSQQQQQPSPIEAPAPSKERKKRGPKTEKEDKPPRDKKDNKRSSATSRKAKEESVASPLSGLHPDPAPSKRGGRGSGTPAPRGSKKDSLGEGSYSTQRSTASSPVERPENIIPRREVDEDYDDAAASSLMDLASSRPPVLSPVVAPGDTRPQHGRQNSIASLISPTTSTGPSSANDTRLSTPKRARPTTPEPTGPSTKRTRIEILNASSIPAVPSSSAAPRSPSPVRRLTPIPMASRAPSDSRFQSTSSRHTDSPPPTTDPSPPHAQSPRELSKKTTIKSPSPMVSKVPPSNDPPLPAIATLSPAPTSPKGDDPADEANRSEGGASDMLVDSEHSSTPGSLGGNKGSGGAEKGDGDAMAIDTTITKTASKASTPAD